MSARGEPASPALLAAAGRAADAAGRAADAGRRAADAGRRATDAGRRATDAAGTRAYIVGPAYDWAFFLLPPVVALAVGALIAGTPLTDTTFELSGERTTWAGLFIGTLIHGHLAAVFLRSHGNADIFRRHRLRFVVAPVAAFAAMMLSMWAVVCVTVLVVFWDVYHSALQTFGLGRIYDARAGNDPALGRRLDLWLNHLLYAGPIVAGATMIFHFESFDAFDDVGAALLSSVPARMASNHRYIGWAVIAAGTVFLLYYALAYRAMARRGYKVSFPKVWLLVSTGLCSIYTWGFNPWGQAFFIMNLFHAVQYLALVWWSEGGRLRRRLRLDRPRAGRLVAVAAFLGGVLAYGLWAELAPAESRALWSLTQTVALMHFWYDGFIWSVTRKQV
ncbi:hypothetical protein SOCEGT47_016920 [Sorangium cellulosum]|uniref:Transmembrane protein n=1 Tax=Sorangium cellulosum TaxID=56 RepID=A0A4P2PXJ4_SORCE|nr:hypothetical protein [Sorangium cellulosum]AUX21213.1 hypothetical protein SOCEGT47_016920 [Sorangium cellulosum]